MTLPISADADAPDWVPPLLARIEIAIEEAMREAREAAILAARTPATFAADDLPADDGFGPVIFVRPATGDRFPAYWTGSLWRRFSDDSEV